MPLEPKVCPSAGPNSPGVQDREHSEVEASVSNNHDVTRGVLSAELPTVWQIANVTPQDRACMIDLRVGRIIKLGRVRITPSLDVLKLFNTNTVTQYNDLGPESREHAVGLLQRLSGTSTRADELLAWWMPRLSPPSAKK